MYVVMGATGHVGAAVAERLLDDGADVVVAVREPGRAESLRKRGAEVVQADVGDVDALRAAFRRGRRAFILNPPADPSTDTDAAETRSAANILAALRDSGLEKIVVASTYGAQPGERIGDLSVLWTLEEGVNDQEIPAAINRGAYYMSNWEALLNPVRESGELPTMIPAEFRMPMVAPADLGRAAAARLVSSVDDIGVQHVEGPERYTPADVAAAFARALGRPVDVDVTPREAWQEAFAQLGFSESAAESYARMTEVSVDGGFDLPDEPRRGSTTLDAYIDAIAARSEEGADRPA